MFMGNHQTQPNEDLVKREVEEKTTPSVKYAKSAK